MKLQLQLLTQPIFTNLRVFSSWPLPTVVGDWTLLTSHLSSKKNIKSAERKAPSFPFKVPCFFSGCFWHCVCLDFVDGNQTLVSHDQRHTDSWDFQRGSPSDCWKMQIHNRNHSYNHHLNIHLFDDLFDVLFHVMDIWSEIYHLGYCHLQLLFTNSQVLKLFNGRCSTCI